MAEAVTELEKVLMDVTIPVDSLVRGGGGEGEFTQRLRHILSDGCGWKKHKFEIKKIVDGEEKEATSHEIDHVKRFSSGDELRKKERNKKHHGRS
ncbi:MAG: hypothetical protein SWC96_07330 [Thermodesulfobacteriota bacterium]|nr:hypothetical protein [Thermodesulfobacteriota bacterium]